MLWDGTNQVVVIHFYRFLMAMPAYSANDDALAVKLLTGYPENEKQGLPSLISNILVFNPSTGVPRAVCS